MIHISTIHYTKMLDDIDGTEASNTVNFSYGDRRFAIDLSDGNVKKLEAALAPYIKAARPQGKVAAAKRATKAHTPAVKIDNAQAQHVREWARGRDQEELRKLARTTGIEVADRGRLSIATLTAAYNASNPTKRTEGASNGLAFSSAQ